MTYTRRSNLVTGTIENEMVILDLPAGHVHQLNVTASRIWNECDGVSTAAEIATRVAASFDEPPDVQLVLQDVLNTLTEFERLGLLMKEPGHPSIPR